MDTSTAYTLASNSVNTLKGYFTALFTQTQIIGFIIGITMFFAVFLVLKSLWHRHL